MCCFRLLHETISLQFGYKDSANRRQCTICKDKNCKLQPYLTFILLNFRRKGKLKKLKKLRKLKTIVFSLPFGSFLGLTYVFNFLNFLNFFNFPFLRKLSF